MIKGVKIIPSIGAISLDATEMLDEAQLKRYINYLTAAIQRRCPTYRLMRIESEMLEKLTLILSEN